MQEKWFTPFKPAIASTQIIEKHRCLMLRLGGNVVFSKLIQERMKIFLLILN